MELRPYFNSVERFQLEQDVNLINAGLEGGRQPQQSLGRDDFLRILITQLSFQDPTAPVNDREFIAQMAQFSSLEQMTSMAADFSRLTSMLAGSEATSALGRHVEIMQGDQVIQGEVQAVTRGETPQVIVDGSSFNWDQVVRVFSE
ncbi:MAG: flagellar hook assembly protein FlgD [Spirochaetes bacterium]|nr:flagellar hook assembly protein FlgD [Spirochaetota bacterium]